MPTYNTDRATPIHSSYAVIRTQVTTGPSLVESLMFQFTAKQ